ncbi:MAG: bifunctional pyr operon transcriptional regulator/uracil phosphoribosyltransferase PyrR [Flavobacteriales bacterium]
MHARPLLDPQALSYTLDRLAFEVYERHGEVESLALVALQPRGIYLGRKIAERLKAFAKVPQIKYGELDITFHRDDFRRRDEVLVPSKTNLEFSVEGQNIILIDDVLYTGRTVRSGLDALLDFGRPANVELMVLIDRRFSRELPVQPDYTGRIVDVVSDETVKVLWGESEQENQVVLYSSGKKE